MTLEVLIVDDSWAMRKFILKQLRAAAIEVSGAHEASNGAEALELLERQRVNLVLTDINMPVMDGLELARRIRERPKLAGMPLIFISSDPRGRRDEELRSLGVIGYVEKPFTPAKLLGELDRLMGLAAALESARRR